MKENMKFFKCRLCGFSVEARDKHHLRHMAEKGEIPQIDWGVDFDEYDDSDSENVVTFLHSHYKRMVIVTTNNITVEGRLFFFCAYMLGENPAVEEKWKKGEEWAVIVEDSPRAQEYFKRQGFYVKELKEGEKVETLLKDF